MRSQNGWCWLCSNNPNFMHTPYRGHRCFPWSPCRQPLQDRMRAKTLDFFTQSNTKCMKRTAAKEVELVLK